MESILKYGKFPSSTFHSLTTNLTTYMLSIQTTMYTRLSKRVYKESILYLKSNTPSVCFSPNNKTHRTRPKNPNPKNPSTNQANLIEQFMGDSISEEASTSPAGPTLLIKIMSKRRTWVFLFITVYSLLLFSCWNLLKSVLSWYESTVTTSNSSGWPAIYASVALGVIFGLLSMVAALAVAVPATLVTWITVLVMLTFFGKPRKTLVGEGKKLTAEITGFVGKVLIKEGNVVAAVCAVLGYFVLIKKNIKEEEAFVT